jgi:hypothetical protein
MGLVLDMSLIISQAACFCSFVKVKGSPFTNLFVSSSLKTIAGELSREIFSETI